MNRPNLDSEVKQVYEEMIEEHRETPSVWVITEIVNRHPGVEGEDSPWYIDRAYSDVSDAVERYVRRVKASEDQPAVEQEDLFPGYRRLQRRYVVTRSSAQIIVPVEDLTDEEVLSKIQEHKAQAEGHLLHAEELQRFLTERRQSA